jgi:hypothetical protein
MSVSLPTSGIAASVIRVVRLGRAGFLAKIAAVSEAMHGRWSRSTDADAAVTRLAAGDGWRVSDLVCRRGPHDRPFEEQHECVTIALVAAGTFQWVSERIASITGVFLVAVLSD